VFKIGDQIEMAAIIILEGRDRNRKFIRNDLTKTIYTYTVLYFVDDAFDIGFWWDFEYTDFNGFQLEVWE
jgi:hypothetical protein